MRIKQQIRRVDNLGSKVKEIEKKLNHNTFEIDPILKSEQVISIATQQKQEKSKHKQLIREAKENPENLIDLTTDSVKNFTFQANTITLVKQLKKKNVKFQQQILLDVVITQSLNFGIRIRKTKGKAIMVGVVDRLTRKEDEKPHRLGNCVCYNGNKGWINYGLSGKWQCKQTNDSFAEGMLVKVKVQMEKKKLTFILIFEGKSVTHEISSDILCQSNRQFVPFLQMWDAGDSAEWFIQ